MRDLSAHPDKVDELIAAARSAPNGEVAAVDRQIAAFEERYGFGSAEMRERVARGELPETADLEAWMMSLTMRDFLASITPRTR